MSWTHRLTLLLAVSIALNLLLAGILVGAQWSRRGPGPSRSFERGARFPGNLEQSLEPHRRALSERRRGASQARAEARTLLQREPLDRAALERALARLRSETQGSQAIVHRALVEAAVAAPPERRRELGRALGPGHKGGRRGDGPALKGPRPDPSAD